MKFIVILCVLFTSTLASTCSIDVELKPSGIYSCIPVDVNFIFRIDYDISSTNGNIDIVIADTITMVNYLHGFSIFDTREAKMSFYPPNSETLLYVIIRSRNFLESTHVHGEVVYISYFVPILFFSAIIFIIIVLSVLCIRKHFRSNENLLNSNTIEMIRPDINKNINLVDFNNIGFMTSDTRDHDKK